MGELIRTVALSSPAGRDDVRASLVEMTAEDAERWLDEVWWTHPPPRGGMGTAERDRKWNWRVALEIYARMLGEGAAVVTEDGRAQGAMIFVPGVASAVEPGAKTVYIERLATAPWNRTAVVGEPEHRGVGTALMLHAIRESVRHGYGGRIALSSLRDPATMRFYERLGMVATGRVDGEDLPIYELPPAAADRILSNNGGL